VTSPAGIGVCFGDGDGTFQSPVLYQAGGDSLLGYPVVGDFNGDGIPDVALPADSGIWLFTGKGGGVFNPGVLIPVTPYSATATAGMAAADLNGDSYLDLAVSYGSGPSGFAVLFGNGDGTFQTPVIYATSWPRWIASSDLNLDGHPDLVLGAASTGPPVYMNNGSGGFVGPTQVNLSGGELLAIGDVNGDGIPDLVSIAGYCSARLRQRPVCAVSVLLNEGQGKFVDGEYPPLPNSGNCGAATGFNGDGKPDLAVPTA
jgi:hypothetical protein